MTLEFNFLIRRLHICKNIEYFISFPFVTLSLFTLKYK